MAVNYIELDTAASDQVDDLIDQIATSITGLANHWSVVQNGYTGQSNYYRTVLKCASTGSGLTADFFVILYRYSTDNFLYMTVCESYDETTNTIGGYPFLQHTSDADCKVTSTSTTLTYQIARFSYSSSSSVAAGKTTIETSNKVALFVYEDGIAVSARNPTGGTYEPIYAGAFNSLVVNPAVNDPLPLGLFAYRRNLEYENPAYFTGFFTRWAMNPSRSAPASPPSPYMPSRVATLVPQVIEDVLIRTSSTTSGNYGNTDPYVGTAGFKAAPVAIANAPIVNTVSFSEFGSDTIIGVVRGTMKNTLVGPVSNWGDTLTIGSEVYQSAGIILSKNGSFHSWFLKEITT